MMNQFEDMQKFGKENVDAAVKAFGSISMGAQAIAVESAEFAKKSFEHGASTMEKLVGAKSLDKAIEIQTDFVKSSYEAFVAQSTKVGELYANLAKEMVKPVEAAVAKTVAK